SAVDPSVTTTGGPALKVRRTATEFNVRSGETLVLSGFLSREQSQDLDGLPGLSSLPILGPLFGSRRFQRRETELAIFVTPTV
ncbi:secretion protein, partial [Bacillus subtilis]